MPSSIFTKIKVSGIAAVVPAEYVDNHKDHPNVAFSERNRTIKLTGIEKYRVASDGMCASDLCQRASEILFKEMDISPSTIDGIIFISQSGDHKMPSTACILQEKLSCPVDTLAFDINLGCSGYVYGLYTACSFISGGGLNRVLLLCGDTQSKFCCEHDKSVNFMMGDAGSATIVEPDDSAKEIKISLKTDGSRHDKLIIPAGGFRTPSTEQTRKVQKQVDGGIRSLEHVFMEGLGIYSFTVNDVAKTIQEFMVNEKISRNDPDYLILHQANKFMTEKMAKKLDISSDILLYSLKEYGNTSSASIPLTIALHRQKFVDQSPRCLLSGFGVGLSWGVADITFDNICACPIEEM